MRVIPAIDIKDGKCVRLLKGDFDKVTEYSSDPAAVGQRFSVLPVGDLHIVDLDGARTGAQSNREIVSRIASHSGLDIQLGGGIRSRDDIEAWLAAGVSRCVIGSKAINEPELALDWLREFGVNSIVLALDVKIDANGLPVLTTHGWTESSGAILWDLLSEFDKAGSCHVLCTDVAQDGAMSGPNFQLYSELLERFPNTRLQASGGIRNLEDLVQLRNLGVPAAITGRALLDGAISPAELESFPLSA